MFDGKNAAARRLPILGPDSTVTSLPTGVLYGNEAGRVVAIDPDALLAPIGVDIAAVPPLPAGSLTGSTILLTPTTNPAAEADPFMGVTVNSVLAPSRADVSAAPTLPAGSLSTATRLLVPNPSVAPGANPFTTVTVGSLAPLLGGTGGTGGTVEAYDPLPDREWLVAHFDVTNPSSSFENVNFDVPATVGNKVGLLDDESGFGQLVQEGDPNCKPTLVEVNGRRAVRFDKSSYTRLSSLGGKDWMNLNHIDVTWAFVFRTPAVLPTDTLGTVGSICNADDFGGGQIVLVSTHRENGGPPTIAFGRFANLGGAVIKSTIVTQPSTLYVAILRSSYGGKTLDLRVNAVDSPQIVVSDFGTGSPYNLCQFGAIRYATDPFSGDLIESALYRSYKDVFGLARLHRHFATKHGL